MRIIEIREKVFEYDFKNNRLNAFKFSFPLDNIEINAMNYIFPEYKFSSHVTEGGNILLTDKKNNNRVKFRLAYEHLINFIRDYYIDFSKLKYTNFYD